MSHKPDLASAFVEMGRILGKDPTDRLFRERPEISIDFQEGVMRACVDVGMEQQRFKNREGGWEGRKGKWECVVRTSWPTSNWHAPDAIAWARHCYYVAQLAHRCHYIVAGYTWNLKEIGKAVRMIKILLKDRDEEALVVQTVREI